MKKAVQIIKQTLIVAALAGVILAGAYMKDLIAMGGL